ncbi:MAG: tetratricopeptide repeat protein [Kiritimatiellae bacterium]|nr:tetratricopeptide repeat protein [Kiritimatiellia bacterium]
MMIRTMCSQRFNAWFFCVVLLAASLAGLNLLCADAPRSPAPTTDGPAAGKEESQPSKRYLTAFESMSTADRLRERGMEEEAAALYDEALKLFRQLASDYPMWQTNLVTFRANYCRNALEKTLASGQYRHDSAAPHLPAPDGGPEQSVPAADSGRPAAAPLPPPAVATNELAVQIEKAAARERAGDFQNALEMYNAALAGDRRRLPALAGAGRCFLRLGMIDEARDLLFQWCVVPSPDSGVNLLLALILCHDRQFERAIQLAGIALNDDNANIAAHIILGAALAGAGQISAAIAEMQKALELDPRLPETHYNLACLILKSGGGEKTAAGEYYRNALKFGAAPDPALAERLGAR